MNKPTKNLTTLIISFCLATSCIGQEKEDSKFYEVYTKKDYLEDIDELANTLTQTHPNPYKFGSKQDFWRLIEETKKSISDSTIFAEFSWQCSKIIASIDCSHTFLGWENHPDNIIPIGLRMPITARLIDNRLYLTDLLTNKNLLQPGTEIFSINGKKVETIRTNVYQYIRSQGKIESWKRPRFNAFFNALVPYSLGFPENYEIIVKGKKEPIRLSKISNYEPKTRISPTNPCQENLCLNFLQEDKIAVLTLRSFDYYGERYPILTNFLDESFEEINSKGIENLILDVRMNGGGPSDAGIYLLRYLTNEPFRYFSSSAFDEKKELVEPFDNSFNSGVFTLIDGDGGSTTGHFVSLIKHLNLATLVGEELGSNQYCTGGQKEFKLSNTELTFYVGRYTYVTTATSFPEDRGISPDHNVVQGIRDYLADIDTVMEYTIELIGGN